MQEEPFNLLEPLVNDSAKQELEGKLGAKISEPCPDCHDKLREKGFDPQEMKVAPVEFSMASGIGIVKIDPDDTKRSDAASLDQVNEMIIKSNRGILELAEFAQHDRKFLESLNDLVRGRERKYKGKFYHPDCLIIAHLTLDEFRRLSNGKDRNGKQKDGDQKSLASLLARFEVVGVPFNVSPEPEAKIYEKAISESEFPFYKNIKERTIEGQMHIPDRTFQAVADFAVLTRLIDPDQELKDKGLDTKEKKLRLYSGQDVGEIPKHKASEVQKKESRRGKEDFFGEGFFGVSPADMQEKFLAIATKARESGCLDPFTLVARLRDYTQGMPGIDEQARLVFLQNIQIRNEMCLVRSIRQAFRPDYETARETQHDEYIRHCAAYLDPNETLTDSRTGETIPPSETFMRSIEQVTGISETAKIIFRQKAYHVPVADARDGKKKTFNDAEDWLKKGIDSIIFGDPKAVDELLSYGLVPESNSPRIPVYPFSPVDQDKRKRYKEFCDNLIQKHGFCEHCLPKLLKEAKDKGLMEKYKNI